MMLHARQTIQRKFLEELAFTLLKEVLRGGTVIVCVCVFACGVFIRHLGMSKNQKTASGETDDFLTWAILNDSIEAQEST